MKKVIRFLVKFKPTWKIIQFFYKVFNRFRFEKDLIQLEEKRARIAEREKKFRELFGRLKVMHGPFKGMVYPEYMAHGSSLYPKLLGSYESELYNDIEELLKNDYKTIIDVGSAEGYYAIGFAMRKPEARVFAYDVDKVALDACRKMAVANKVDKQMEFGEFCSAKVLADMKLEGRSLVLSDCEGYEMELFTKESVANLKNSDIIIEVHDLYNEKITPALEEVFRDTHDIKKVYSISTFGKLKDFKEAEAFSDEDINTFMVERNGIMVWFIVTPKAGRA